MIDDDLDRLLSDVDSASDYSGAREDSLRFKQRMARKSDINIEASGDGVHSEKAFIDRILGLEVDNDIMDFAKGAPAAVHVHTIKTGNFRRLLSEYSVPDSVQSLIQKYKYTFIRFIENVERLYAEFAIPLSIDSLIKKARKDYPLYFEGFEEENKLDFIMLTELFLRLREFNSRARKEWSELSKSIGVINLAVEGKGLYSELNAQVESALVFCEGTDRFLARIALFLAIPTDDYDVIERDISNKTIYYQSMSYKYDALFNIGAYIDGGTVKQKTSGGALDLDAEGIHGDEIRGHQESPPGREASEIRGTVAPAGGARDFSEQEVDTGFRVRGTSAWNTREPYTMRLSREKLDRDYEDITNSFHYTREPETTTSQEGAVKRAMIRFLSDTSKNIEIEYEEFIFKTIITQTQELCDFFGFQDEMRNLFVYHMGPSTLHRALISLFQIERIGLCFKYLPGNRVVRYIPTEFIKEKILKWYEANVNTLNIDFDKVHYFDEVRRTVLMKYNKELAANGRQLDEMIAKLKLDENPQFNKQEFFKSKWNQWFGTARIPVYNRFIEKSIFR